MEEEEEEEGEEMVRLAPAEPHFAAASFLLPATATAGVQHGSSLAAGTA